MRLRILELPMTTRPDTATYVAPDAPTEPWTPFVLVLDDFDEHEDQPPVPTAAAWREATGARGVLVFAGRVDIPAVDAYITT